MSSDKIGISWQLSDRHGWGIFGFHLAMNLIQYGPCPPLLLSPPNFTDMTDQTVDILKAHIWNQPNHPYALERTTVLHSVGNGFRENYLTHPHRGRRNDGFAFFETTDFDTSAIQRAKAWDHLYVGSLWNRSICEQLGIENVTCILQGVDTDRFSPAPRQGVPSGRFVVFSGGKIEFRKGQDQTLAAFKIFNRKHPDSLLVTAWQNGWEQSAATIQKSPHTQSRPVSAQDGKLAIAEWALENGVPADAFIDLGWIPNHRLPAVLNEVDVGVFPSRCEGGTNLAAMEAMSCGIPCILSANTGHLDIIKANSNCYALQDQSPYAEGPEKDWRHSNIDEIIEYMEQAYTNSSQRREIGTNARATMTSLSWDNQINKLKTLLTS